MSTVAVTGASGLLGRHLCDHLRREGHAVRALLRRPDEYPFAEPGVTTHRCDLPDHLDEAALRGADTLIHAAYMTRFTSVEEGRRVNEVGTRHVLDAARRHGVRVVFVSSLAAHDDARSYYGQSKLALERLLDPARDLIVRPGLVLAGDGGLFGRMVQTVRRSPLVLLLGGRQVIQTVHIDDLCAGVLRALRDRLTGRLVVCEPGGLRFGALLAAVARHLKRRRLFVPVPAWPVLLGLRACERAGLRPPVSSENVLGLLSARAVDPTADLARLGVRVRGAEESLAALLASGGVSC